jgi:purine-binding chemotaxis protein CheW
MKDDIYSILRKRAIAMAIEPKQIGDSASGKEIIEFILGEECYGIESAFVREVYAMKDFTPLPAVPSFILGIVNVRGQILPVVDLKKFFNLSEKGLGEFNKLIILHNEQMEFAILADAVKGTKMIYEDEVLAVPPIVSGIGEKYLKGVTKDLLIILSAENLLSDKNLVINEEVTQ